MSCALCNGEGYIVTCSDDICCGLGHCIHGDGEATCPRCGGDGEGPEDRGDYDEDEDEEEAIDPGFEM